jgi:hypothetical protein
MPTDEIDWFQSILPRVTNRPMQIDCFQSILEGVVCGRRENRLKPVDFKRSV